MLQLKAIIEYTVFSVCLVGILSIQKGMGQKMSSTVHFPKHWMKEACQRCRCKHIYPTENVCRYFQKLFVSKQVCTHCQPPCTFLPSLLKGQKDGASADVSGFSLFATLDFHIQPSPSKDVLILAQPTIQAESGKLCDPVSLDGQAKLGYYISVKSSQPKQTKSVPFYLALDEINLYPMSKGQGNLFDDMDYNFKPPANAGLIAGEQTYIAPRSVVVNKLTGNTAECLFKLLQSFQESLSLVLRCPPNKNCITSRVSVQAKAVCSFTTPISRDHLVNGVVGIIKACVVSTPPKKGKNERQFSINYAKLEKGFKLLNSLVLRAGIHFATQGQGQQKRRKHCAAFFLSNVYNTLASDVVIKMPMTVPNIGIPTSTLRRKLLLHNAKVKLY